MNYALELLKTALRNELLAEEQAKICLDNRNNEFSIRKGSYEAFTESRRLAEERIPQLEEAIKFLVDIL